MNFDIYSLFISVISLSTAGSVGYWLWHSSNGGKDFLIPIANKIGKEEDDADQSKRKSYFKFGAATIPSED